MYFFAAQDEIEWFLITTVFFNLTVAAAKYDQGDIRKTKSDSKIDSKVDPVVVELEVGPAVVDNNEWCHLKTY